METVEPIRDKKQIEAMKKILKSESQRNYLLFIFGINTALRISDILKIRFCDVMDENRKVLDRLRNREQKTKKERSTIFTPSVKKELQSYIDQNIDIDINAPLFYSRKKKGGELQPISRQMAYMTINRVADLVGLKNVGTHTMRKTWGYHAYKNGTDLTLIQNALNHSAPSVTLRYIGITQDDIDNVMINLDL